MSGVSSARKAPLSARAVEALKETSFVGGVAGLQLVVSPRGTRSWRLFYRVAGGDGRRQAMALGRFPEVGLAQARKRASSALAEAANGLDPKSARQQAVAKAQVTVAIAVERYLAACAASNDAKTIRDKASAFRTHLLPTLGAEPITSLDRSAALSLLDGLVEAPATRRVLYSYLRHFLSWAAEREIIAENPLLGVKAPKPIAARERVLSDDEIRALWRATGPMADIARLSLLTAQRKGSIEALRRQDVDLEAGQWLIPAEAMKSARSHLVPLSPLAVDILRRIAPKAGPYLFGVGSDGAKPYGGASKGFRSLQRQIGLLDWRMHDLRRTAVTLAQRAGRPLEAITALTQHKTPGVIGVYARHAYVEEKRAVSEAIEREVAAILAYHACLGA